MNLLDADVVRLRRIRTSRVRAIALADTDLHPLAEARPHGSTARRILLGARAWDVIQQQGPVFTLTDPRGLGHDRFEVLWPDGGPVATLTGRLLSGHLDIAMADGSPLTARDISTGYNFHRGPHLPDHGSFGPGPGSPGHAARLQRDPSVIAMREAWATLTLAPGLPAEYRVAVLGAVIALDLLRAKKRAVAASG